MDLRYMDNCEFDTLIKAGPDLLRLVKLLCLDKS